ncbi:MAG: purine-binding chemotaxis protein CheW [Phormidesmis sp. RL_2_1]|nr:purine-binding chemotaxis protein CheW [Phormidesmis sp. RL_2_1]
MKTQLAIPDRQLMGDAYLKFQLAPRVPAVFAARVVEEAIVLPTSQVTAIPNMPSCMLGLVNRRNRVIWIVNLVRLLGMPVPDRPRQHYSMVIVKSGSSLGLMVDDIDGIVHLRPDELQPTPAQVNPILVPYLRGCAVHNDQILLVLDAEAVLQSSVFQG